MSEFSRETLLNIIETDHVQCGEASALARMALAAMDSEPVAWRVRFKLEGQPGSNFNKFFENRKSMDDVVSLHELDGFNIDVTPLYRHAQPVTVVPDKMTAIVKDEAEYVEGWNACRAAMLAAAQQEGK
ncbi:TPA: hypothetical protein MI661_26930 [Klebsiella pneumoniae]|nr:hypothetical protein [Klebsiella pneumoniae]